MEAQIVLLPGDGIGPEVVAAAAAVLEAVGEMFGHTFTTAEYPLGGIAIDHYGTALPAETLAACQAADAVLLGAVGGPTWDDPSAAVRPEQGLLGLRKALDLFGNLRPVRPHPDLVGASPLRPERLEGVDLLVVRELTGGLNFGEPRGRALVEGRREARNTLVYDEVEIERIARVAFEAARGRRRHVTHVHKANVLEVSQLWVEVVNEVAKRCTTTSSWSTRAHMKRSGM